MPSIHRHMRVNKFKFFLVCNHAWDGIFMNSGIKYTVALRGDEGMFRNVININIVLDLFLFQMSPVCLFLLIIKEAGLISVVVNLTIVLCWEHNGILIFIRSDIIGNILGQEDSGSGLGVD